MDWMTLFVGLAAVSGALAVLGSFIKFIIQSSLKAIEKDIEIIKEKTII